jgi:hypothetical protein
MTDARRTAPTPAPARLAAAVLGVGLAASLLAGCSDDRSEAPGAGSSAATSTPVPTAGSQGNPFKTTFEGASSAAPGDLLTETLTNAGRLPDAYQVVVDPADAAQLKESSFHLSPGESVEVRLRVASVPFDIHLKSVGGGSPDVVAKTIEAE